MKIFEGVLMRTIFLIISIFLISGCSDVDEPSASAPSAAQTENYEWKMVTTWPKNYPGLGLGADALGSSTSLQPEIKKMLIIKKIVLMRTPSNIFIYSAFKFAEDNISIFVPACSKLTCTRALGPFPSKFKITPSP
jgi:uncharacterized protein YceK